MTETRILRWHSMNNVLEFFESRGIPKEFVRWDDFAYTEKFLERLKKIDGELKVDKIKFHTQLIQSLNYIYEPFKAEFSGYHFQGCNGCGKTAWASVMVRQALLEGINSMIISMQSLITAYFNEHKLPKDIAIVDLLVIDEVGKELQKNSGGSVLMSILDRRMQDGKKTILISNASADKLIEGYGATFHSKFHYFKPLYFPEVDFRKSINTLQNNTVQNNGIQQQIIEVDPI